MARHQLKNKITDEEVSDLLFAIELASMDLISQLKSAKRMREKSVISITINELRSRKRITEFIFARMIFSKICHEQYTVQAIADYLGIISHASICKYLKNFPQDIRYISGFRVFYMEVSRILKGITTRRESAKETNESMLANHQTLQS